MSIDPIALEQLSRDALIAMAGQLGAKRPELLTRPELRDEIIRLSETDEEARKRARGWFGVARDLVASVVAQGLSLPDTADLIRGVNVRIPKSGPPVATVTLAEIYAAQGHLTKALKLLDEVLAREPDHEAARLARERYAPTVNQDAPRMPPEPEEEAATEEVAESPEAATEEVRVDSASDTPPSTSALCGFEDSSADDASADDASVDDASADHASADHASADHASADHASADHASADHASEEVPASPSTRVPLEAEVAQPRSVELGSKAEPGVEPTSPSQPVAERSWALLLRRENYSPLFVWNLSPDAYDRLSAEERSALCVRILEVTPGWDGPVSSESFLTVHSPRGRTELIVGSGVLRVALGVRRGDGFTPLGVAAQFSIGSAQGTTPVWLPATRTSPEEWNSLVRPIAEQLTATPRVQ